MGRTCAVASCKVWSGGKSKKKKAKGSSFFAFPTDKEFSSIWAAKCKRADHFNPSTSHICSAHFSSDAYCPSYLTKLKLMPDGNYQPTLKPDAVPSLNLPSNSKSCDTSSLKRERLQKRSTLKELSNLLGHQTTCPSTAANPPEQLDAARRHGRVTASSAVIRRLRKDITRLRAQHCAERLKWRRHTARLRREVCELREKSRAPCSAPRGQMGCILSRQQLRRLATGKRTCWNGEDISKAVGLRCVSRKAYAYVRNAMLVPLPSESTLSRWTRRFQLGLGGLIDAALWVLQPAVEAMTSLDRISAICFDEMSLNCRPTYDQSGDVILDGGKLQVMMVRGLCSPWKQPFFQELDAPVTIEKLTAVIHALGGLGLDVRAVTSDMGVSNEVLWRDAGVTMQKTWIPHPTDSTKKVWIFADVPHLIKLVRHHVVKDDGGLLVPDGCGGEILLDAAPFRELRALDCGEMKICPKLTKLCIEARNQTAQRVRLATRLFSGTVATAMEAVLHKPAVARAVSIVDRWFDSMNSRCTSDTKLERCGYGSSDAAKEAQDSALRDMDELMANARKPGGRRRPGPASAVALLPFQRGILRSSASVRGLYGDLQSAYPGQLGYLLTSRLNQDCLENCFSQLRGMGGQNTNPDAVEVRQRLRAMLMARSTLRAISCPERAVEVESDTTDYISTGQPPVAPPVASPSAPSMAELDALTIEFVEPADEEDAVTLDHDYSRATDARLPTTDDDAVGELGLEREGLAFVAGYVASKMEHIDPSLGCLTSKATDAMLKSVPSSWLATISRGRLHLPQPCWMAAVEGFEAIFRSVMGPDFTREAGVVKRLVTLIAAHYPTIDPRIARRLAHVRLQLRVRWLRQKREAIRTDKRAAKQIRQHIASNR